MSAGPSPPDPYPALPVAIGCKLLRCLALVLQRGEGARPRAPR